MTTVATVHEAAAPTRSTRPWPARAWSPASTWSTPPTSTPSCWCASREDHGIDLVGPAAARTRPGRTRSRAATRSTASRSTGTSERARCPQGKLSSAWSPAGRPGRHALRLGLVPQGRLRRLPGAAPVHAWQAPGPAPEAAAARRARGAQGRAGAARDQGGPAPYARRAGIEGTISQGVRAFGLRRSRYRGLAKTHLQHVATAAAINVERLAAWFRAVPRAATRTSRFAGLAAA